MIFEKSIEMAHGSTISVDNNYYSKNEIPTNNLDNRKDYWNFYYQNQSKTPPSQFAAFIASEYPDHELIIDVGCGNGRDTIFFAQLGYNTVGIDGSKSAIEHCQKMMAGYDRNSDANIFIEKDVSDLSNNIQQIIKSPAIKKIIYSRFFLHAINEYEEQEFLDFAFSSINAEDRIALEFRTNLDEHKEKVTGKHYRRYIDTSIFIEHVTKKYNAKLMYCIEGTGFAKYKNDDAHVCRIILAK